MSKKKPREYDVHHRYPQCLGQDNSPENTIIVPKKHHEAYHILFGHGGDVENTAKILNEKWIDPRYKLIVIKKED